MRQDAGSAAMISTGAPVSAAWAEVPRIAVVIASKGRPLETSYVLQALAHQTLTPSAIVLSVVTTSDLPDSLPPSVTTIFGPAGSSSQRNRGLAEVADHDIIVFFDDDFLPTPTALAGMASLFQSNLDVVGATGLVLQDGVTCGGLDLATATASISEYAARPAEPIFNTDLNWVYGCNMAFRASAIGDVRFDENLPLYGWQEDVDFAGQISKAGRIVRTNAFAGVHLGVNKSRASGVKLGYSQMINPVYLVRKGTMSPTKAGLLMIRNFLANHVRAISPEPWIDRRGRVRGNWRAISHLLRGQADPTAILRF